MRKTRFERHCRRFEGNESREPPRCCVASENWEVGDRIADAYSVYSAVSELIPTPCLPLVRNEKTGQMVVMNRLLSTTSITEGSKGGTPELAAIATFDQVHPRSRLRKGPNP